MDALKSSASRVVNLSDKTIRATVQRFGPGTAAEKSKLADTLIARRNSIREQLDIANPF